MNQMKIIGKSILRGVHAHGRHRDAVAEGNATNGQRRQKIYLVDFTIVFAMTLGFVDGLNDAWAK